MPSDAKFGLVVGMLAVLLIALLFFRKEGTPEVPAAAPAPMQTPKVEAPKIEAPKVEIPALPPSPKVEIPSLPDEAPVLPPPAFEPIPPPPPAITMME